MSKKEMNLYKRCKNIFKSHGVDMGGGSVAPVLEFMWEAKGQQPGEEIVRTDLTWKDIANAIKSNPITVAHVIYQETGDRAIFPVIMFSENKNGGAATFGSGGVLFGGTTEDGSKKWIPHGGILSVGCDPETGEMTVHYTNNFGP